MAPVVSVLDVDWDFGGSSPTAENSFNVGLFAVRVGYGQVKHR